MQHGIHVRNLTLFQIPLIYMCDFPSAISDLNYCSTCIYLRHSLRTADAFPVIASLPPKNSVCEPERQNDFRDVKPLVLM